MPSFTSVALVLAITATVAGLAAYVRRRTAAADESDQDHGIADPSDAAPPDSLENTVLVPYATDATADVHAQCFKLAFGVNRFDYQIFADHARVIESVEQALGDAAEHEQYFPRRPLLLPKLLQALKDTQSTRAELVRLILEDPTLAGTTLKRANNAFYRMSARPVESLDRAVALLGSDGLRGLLSTAILQPVFRLPKGFFDRFATIAWEQAQRSAATTQAYATTATSEDPFIAQLLGVLRSLATLVLFRLTLEKYRDCPNVLPRPEVFVRILQSHQGSIALQIAKTWQLSEQSLTALDEQRREESPSQMSSLGRAVYFGELATTLVIATANELYSEDGAHAILVEQGLEPELAKSLLQAARDADVESG